MNNDTRPDAGTEARSVDLRFVTRGVTHVESAAVSAVVLAALEDSASAAPAAEVGRDAWVRSGGALRTPFTRGPGAWTRSGR
jgi:hypothetical protein